MSDEQTPHLDDLVLVSLEPEPRIVWLFDLWSSYCAARGEPNGRCEEQPLDYSNKPRFLENLRFAFERFEAGNLIALIDALHVCRSNGLHTPDWVLSGMEDFMLDSIKNGTPGKQGRSNSPLARAKLAVKHEKQRETIRRIRFAQKFPPEMEFLYALILPNEVKRYFDGRPSPTLGSNLQDAVELAEICLRGTEFQATFSTLERLAKSIPDATFDISEYSVRKALGIDALDMPPEDFGSYSFGWPDGTQTAEAENWELESTDAVKETAVFWLTIRRGAVRPVS